ncbi:MULTISPECIES: AraC family transcriptional regulator [unclassified Lacinutrix]|uniref:helix-turn-helix domain-containing protein n=1 Tax=unclassified Lacinutrix TaxID=2647285 RepID=UPI00020A3BFC|nr:MULTISPECIES: AraC family transcriptional regulator [unclassified Lacinutrix]AEH01039.1 transcriptional regulator, AraC family [Lacinutrix sp. 5H-3-7-4]OIQ23649.1 MAG: AraC family transcriptional regulator [Lacinutrix sp. MedPE-SW]
MALQDIETYTFKDIFSLSVVQFDKACVVNKPEQVDVYSIYWIKKGKGLYNIDFKSFEFSENVLFFLSPGQVFSVENESIKEAYKITFIKDFYCIQTHDKEVSCNGVLFNNVYKVPFIKPCKSDTQKLSFILDSLIEEFKNVNTAQHDMLQSYLKQFIIHSVRIQSENYPVDKNIETRLFKDFSTILEQNYKTIHSVTEYAKRLGISPKSLTKNFQKIGAQTPSDIIKNRIIIEAKRQLIYTKQSVKEIAYSLGFNDSAYFSRYFSKATSKSPLQFRKDY